MYTYRQAAASACVLFALVGCAHSPVVRPLNNDVANAIQTIDIKIGVPHQELHAEFERSNGGAAAAAGCGAIPGIGLLLAAACGGAAGAVDATINTARAKAADETVRPLKDEIVDVNFNQIVTDSLKESLKSVPGMQPTSMTVTNTVNDGVYEEIYRASTANGVMFVNVDYYLTADFSTLEMAVNAHIFPRSAAARKAAKLSAELPTKDVQGSDRASPQEKQLASSNAAYHSLIFYDIKLPRKAETKAEYVEAWKTDGARKLRTSIADGTHQIARLLAEDLLRRFGDTERPALSKVDNGKGLMVDVIAENENGKLLRYANGTLHYRADAAIFDHLKTLESTATVSTPSFAPQKTVMSAPTVVAKAEPIPVAVVPATTDTNASPPLIVKRIVAEQPAPTNDAETNASTRPTPATYTYSAPANSVNTPSYVQTESPPPVVVAVAEPMQTSTPAITYNKPPVSNAQPVGFKLGQSSGTVEKMGRQNGCDSQQGAGLIGDIGPIETYRMSCTNGAVYMARCELRQCTQMQE
ncbi:MAG TPA: hypothetical protein VNW52_04525 [Burkholderiaceae bacterium]|nr:hypothetical protein [Burkholderiaceae bacterium]